jgi:hypothetical protein
MKKINFRVLPEGITSTGMIKNCVKVPDKGKHIFLIKNNIISITRVFNSWEICYK